MTQARETAERITKELRRAAGMRHVGRAQCGRHRPVQHVEVYGQAAWETFQQEFDDAVVGREDEWRQLIPELGGAGN